MQLQLSLLYGTEGQGICDSITPLIFLFSSAYIKQISTEWQPGKQTNLTLLPDCILHIKTIWIASDTH